MKNKTLLLVVLFLIPIAIISFEWIETNFNLPPDIQEIEVKLRLNEETNITLPLEEYVLGVVAAEMPASFHEEALKAQAIATRSFTLSKLNSDNIYEVTLGDQAYITKEEMQHKWQDEYNKYYKKIETAVNDTKNKVMTHDGKIITAFYFAMSNGYTENAINVFKEEDYLKTVESTWEDEKINKFVVVSSIPKNEFCQKLDIDCSNIVITEIQKTDSNRIASIKINNKTFSGTEFRKTLSLRSTDFSINLNKDIIEITTKGYGHGVGMSQYGANEMAKKNYTFDSILKHYYQGIEIITK